MTANEQGLPGTARAESRMQACLFCGLLLVFLAVWKGDGGYTDLREFLDNAVNLWLKGDLSVPDGQPLVTNGYYIHPLGSAFMAGPFVLAGAVVDWLTRGAIGVRAVAALCIPVYSALACLLLFKMGRELRAGASASLWAALILALGSPLLSYTQLFFAEGCTALSVCFAGWAYLKAQRTAGRTSLYWTLLSGAGLAGISACHFNNVVVSLCLAGAIGWALCRGDRGWTARLWRLAALGLVPLLAGAALMLMNAHRFGSPLATGYAPFLAESVHPVSVLNVPGNFGYLARWLLRVPWALPALPALIYFGRKRPAQKLWLLGVAAAATAQLCFFQMYYNLKVFPVRYHQTAVILLALGLVPLGKILWERWRGRGLFYTGLLLGMQNLFCFMASDHSAQAFFLSPAGGCMNCHVWYMQPLTHKGFGSPMGAAQILVLALLLSAGAWLLARAAREAARLDNEPRP